MLDARSAESQQQLLRRIAAKDHKALADFYDQIAGVLYSTSLRILGDASEAEEVIQDAFVQIWDKAATFDATLGAPFHWALGIARNRSIDRVRARARRSRLIDELWEDATAKAGAQPVPGLLSEDEVRTVRQAVSDLPPEQRQSIEMAFFGGLTHNEIAEMLKQPLGTIKARIRRGMLKLRKNLQSMV